MQSQEVVEELGIVDESQDIGSQDTLVQDNRSRLRREGARENNHHLDNCECSSCLVVLLHNLKGQPSVSLQKINQ